MNPAEKKILNDELPTLANEISEPQLIADCIEVFNDVDKEKVKAANTNLGQTEAVHTLISRLKKRGPKAFGQFLRALEHNYDTTRRRLKAKAEEKGLCDGGEPESAPVQDSQQSSVVSRGPPTTPTEEVNSSSSPHMAVSNYDPSLNEACNIPNQPKRKNQNYYNTAECSKNNGPDTLLKHIPSLLKSGIVSKLNAPSALNKDWKGLAGHAAFTVEDEQQLESFPNPSEALFNLMVQREYTISQLKTLLEEMDRKDLINLIKNHGYFGDDSEHSEDTIQEDLPSSSSNVQTSPTLQPRLSQEATDGSATEELTVSKLSDKPDDDVFLEKISGKALFIGVEAYQEIPKLRRINGFVNTLAYLFKTWDVETNVLRGQCDSKEAVMETVKTFLSKLERDNVCFVYLAGHTVQINGENYLLFSDIGLDYSVADIIECSLNINKLLLDVERCNPLMSTLFVDGAHCNDKEWHSSRVLPGLAAIVPSPKTLVVYPSAPGQVRPSNESLTIFAKSLKGIVEDNEETGVTMAELICDLNRRLPSSFLISRSPKSTLPLSIITPRGPEILVPNCETPRHALVFVDDGIESQNHRRDAEHLSASLKQLSWNVEPANVGYQDRDEIKATLKKRMRELGADNGMKIVMVYFIGFRPKDNNSIAIGNSHTISLEWVVNLMCEYIQGPKILIVDDDSQSNPLDFVSPLPADMLMCVPQEKPEKRDPKIDRNDSFTLSLAQNLSANPDEKLKNIIKLTVENWTHQKMNCTLFFA